MQVAEVDVGRTPQNLEIGSTLQDPQVGSVDIPKHSDNGGELEDGELVDAFYDHQVGSAVDDAEVVCHGTLSQEVAGAEESQ